jgi:hypothetical protein
MPTSFDHYQLAQVGEKYQDAREAIYAEASTSLLQRAQGAIHRAIEAGIGTEEITARLSTELHKLWAESNRYEVARYETQGKRNQAIAKAHLDHLRNKLTEIDANSSLANQNYQDELRMYDQKYTRALQQIKLTQDAQAADIGRRMEMMKVQFAHWAQYGSAVLGTVHVNDFNNYTTDVAT